MSEKSICMKRERKKKYCTLTTYQIYQNKNKNIVEWISVDILEKRKILTFMLIISQVNHYHLRKKVMNQYFILYLI